MGNHCTHLLLQVHGRQLLATLKSSSLQTTYNVDAGSAANVSDYSELLGVSILRGSFRVSHAFVSTSETEYEPAHVE